MLKIESVIRKMRIVFVTTEYVSKENSDGGLANYLFRVSSELKKYGHDPLILVISDKEQNYLDNGIKVIRIDTSSNSFQRFMDFITFKQLSILTYYIRANRLIKLKLREINKEKKISIVQYTNLGGTGLFRIKSIPSVVRMSSYFPLWEKYGEYENYNFLLKIQLNILEKISLRRADSIFAPSNVLAKYVAKDLKREIKVIESPYVIEHIRQDLSVYNMNFKKKKYFLFYGRLTFSKGVFVIAEIIDDLLKKFPDLNFVFIGKENQHLGKESLIDIIKKSVKENSKRVFFLGRIHHKYLFPIIKHALAVVLPSLIDNFPNTCLESMALGKVVVGTRNTSFEQLIINKFSGFLCEPNNPEDLLRTLKIVYGLSEKKRKTIGNNGLLRIKKLSDGKVVMQLIKYFKKIL